MHCDFVQKAKHILCKHDKIITNNKLPLAETSENT